MTPAPEELAGPWAPLLVPIAADGALREDALQDELAALARCGLAGAVLGGRLEEPGLDEGEREALARAVAHCAARHDLPLQLGLGPLADAHARLETCAALDPVALRVGLDGRLTDALDEVAELGARATPHGVVLELAALPDAATVAAAVATLLDHAPAVVGLDLPRADEDVLEALRPFEEQLALDVPGVELASGLRHGASGSVSIVACLAPAGVARWHALCEDDVQAALALERRVQRALEDHLFRLREAYGDRDLPLAKALAAAGGWCAVGTRLREGRGYPAERATALGAQLRARLPELFGE